MVSINGRKELSEYVLFGNFMILAVPQKQNYMNETTHSYADLPKPNGI